jgi:hypothetical protein
MGGTHERVKQRVRHPLPEDGAREERVLLAEHVELRISVENPRGDELIEDADDERREHGEDDVVERQRPGLVRDLTREVVEERKLRRDERRRQRREQDDIPRRASCRA